jgi:hypothetical protein
MSKINGVEYKYVREVIGFNSQYWCDSERCFTDHPEDHQHELHAYENRVLR